MAKNKEVDVFGKMILAQYHAASKPVFEIVERDDGFIEAGSAYKYFTKYPEWTATEKKAMKYVKGRTLDIGCGAGRHALYLQNKGVDVTGMDISKGAIDVCKKSGLNKTLIRSIEELSLFKPASFDTVCLFYNNFGLLQNPRKAKGILKQLYRITSPGAKIIADTSNPYDTKSVLHLNYHAFNRKRGRMGGQLRIRLRHKNLTGSWFDYLFVSPIEAEKILKESGWRINKLIADKERRYIMIIGK